MLDVHRRLTPERLRRATSALIARHEALRLRFRRDDGRFAQRYGDIEGSFAVEAVTLAIGGRGAPRSSTNSIAASASRTAR